MLRALLSLNKLVRNILASITQMESLPRISKNPLFAAEPSRAEWLIRSGEGGRVANKGENDSVIQTSLNDK